MLKKFLLVLVLGLLTLPLSAHTAKLGDNFLKQAEAAFAGGNFLSATLLANQGIAEVFRNNPELIARAISVPSSTTAATPELEAKYAIASLKEYLTINPDQVLAAILLQITEINQKLNSRGW